MPFLQNAASLEKAWSTAWPDNAQVNAIHCTRIPDTKQVPNRKTLSVAGPREKSPPRRNVKPHTPDRTRWWKKFDFALSLVIMQLVSMWLKRTVAPQPVARNPILG